MKTKKTVIAVIAAMLVISAVLIVSCIEPIDEKNTYTADNYQIPAGKGVIRFKLSDSNLRTILPDNDLSNMKFQVILTDATTSTPTTYPSASTFFTATEINSNTTPPIVLDPDDYDVSICAYDTTGLIEIAGWDSDPLDPIKLVPNGSETITANLIAVNSGSATGTFKYNFNIPNDGYTAQLDILNYSTGVTIGATSDATPISLPLTLPTTGALSPGSATIPRGYYIVKVTVAKTNYQTKSYVRALHIYPAMTSTMENITVPALTKVADLKVTFDLGKVNGNDITDTTSGNNYTAQYKTYAATVSAFTYTPLADAPNAGYTFVNWYKNDLKTVLWNFTTDRVLADNTVLYAGWNPPAGLGDVKFKITFDIDDFADGIISGGNISRANFNGASQVLLTIDAAPDSGKWKNIQWDVQGITNTTLSGASLLDTTNDADDTLIINNSSLFWSLLAQPSFEVTVLLDLYDSTGAILIDQGLSCTAIITVTN